MKISIIIPCYNNADLITETLLSVQNQSIYDWECLVVDDGSTDDTRYLVDSFVKDDRRFKAYKRPPDLPKGANSCRNFGASESKGTHLIFLDADDLLAQDCLESRIASTRDEDLSVFSTAHFTSSIQEATPFAPHLNLLLDAAHYRDMFVSYWIPWHLSSGMWDKSFFGRIGGFDVALDRFQDVEIHVRALNTTDIKFKIDHSSGYTSYYRKSSFHTQISLEKRRLILDQGFRYAQKLKSQLSPQEYRKSEGLFIYLLFRFEEVITSADLNQVKQLFTTSTSASDSQGFCWELAVLMNLFEKKLTQPSRFRKYLSYAIFRKYKFTQLRRLNS